MKKQSIKHRKKQRNLNTLLAFTVVLITAIIAINNVSHFSFSGKVVAIASCTDVDGDNPLAASTISATLADGSSQEMTDSCIGNNAVLEYTCNGNSIEEKTYECTCLDGYCNVNLGSLVQQPVEQPRRRS